MPGAVESHAKWLCCARCDRPRCVENIALQTFQNCATFFRGANLLRSGVDILTWSYCRHPGNVKRECRSPYLSFQDRGLPGMWNGVMRMTLCQPANLPGAAQLPPPSRLAAWKSSASLSRGLGAARHISRSRLVVKRTSKDEVRCRFGKRLRSRSDPQAALLLLLVLVSPQRALAALFFECLGTLRSCRQKLRAVCAHESFKCNPV